MSCLHIGPSVLVCLSQRDPTEPLWGLKETLKRPEQGLARDQCPRSIARIGLSHGTLAGSLSLPDPECKWGLGGDGCLATWAAH